MKGPRALLRRRPVPIAAGPGESLTAHWFTRRELEGLSSRYAAYELSDLSYATVRDYVDSFEHLRPLASAQGDLKDVQRPWALKAILASVPVGGRVLEIGGGQPYIADLLARLGYEVWLVDPYDGSGNGPVEYEEYRRACPDVRFVRALFSDELHEVPADAFHCVFSVSVLEHIDSPGMEMVLRGTERCLRAEGISIHAIDHVHRGNGDREHLEGLTSIVRGLGLSVEKLYRVLTELSDDTETYYLSAESHNRWRGDTPYDEFPMRVCVSIQTVSNRACLVTRPT
jgi:2-polyprenyl-3-methyl-5-hydroxy-6-metoxy-1,4-benzoquinol methylase